MIDNDPFFILQHAGGDARPATIETAIDDPVDLSILLSRVQAETNFGSTSVENAFTGAAVMSKDIDDLTITNDGNTTVQVSEIWVTESGELVLDDEGEPVYADGIYNHSIKRKHRDIDGITQFELTEK